MKDSLHAIFHNCFIMLMLYQQEGVGMPYTMKDFERDFTSEHLHLLIPQERLKGLA